MARFAQFDKRSSLVKRCHKGGLENVLNKELCYLYGRYGVNLAFREFKMCADLLAHRYSPAELSYDLGAVPLLFVTFAIRAKD